MAKYLVPSVSVIVLVISNIVAVPLAKVTVESRQDVETYNFNGFQVLRRNDMGACLVIRKDSDNGNSSLLPFEQNDVLSLTGFATVNTKFKELCGSFEMMLLLQAAAPSIDPVASNPSNDDRIFLNIQNRTGTGSINQVIQSLFGVWSIPGLG